MQFDHEHLVGISMTWDGNIVWTSNYGRIGIVDKNINPIAEPFQLPGLDEAGDTGRHYVTNSFAMDKKGGIYVVTSLYMTKTLWNSKDKTF